MCELVGKDCVERILVVDVMGKVYVDLVGAGVGVPGRVYARQVLVFKEYRAVCRGKRGQGEGALHVLAGRGVVEVDRIGLEDVDAVGCGGVDVLVDLSSIEWRVVVFADGDGDGVGGRWLETPSSAHQVMREGCLSVEVKVEASSSGAASEGPAAAASASRSSGVGVVVVVVGGRNNCGCGGDVSRRFELVYSLSRVAMRLVMAVIAASI
jgi:hypothetical protein